jgi:hypothetical protein
MPTKPYETELAHLKQCVPKLVKGSGTPNKSYSEITVRFDGANLENFAQLQKCLEFYGWPTNTIKSGSVTNPAIDGGPQRGQLEGVWRFVSCDPNHSARGEGVYVTLREGYAAELTWDEARVPSRALLPKTTSTALEGTNADEDYIDVLFPNVDPTKSQTMADALLALGTVDAPTIWTHEYTGTYHVIYARPREEEDGSHSVLALLARPRSYLKTYENFQSHNASDVYYLHHVPKSIVQSVVDDAVYKTEGASATANYSTDRGTYDVIIRTGTDEPITVLNKQTEDGCLTEVYTDFYFGISKTTMEGISVGTAPQGWIYRITNLSPAANGKFNMRRDRIKAIAKTCPEYTSEITSSREWKTQEKKNQTSVASIGEAVQGLIKRIRGLVNRFCVYDTTTTTIESTPWEVTFSVTAEDGVEHHTVKGNQDLIDFGSPREGFIHKLTGWSRNEDGTYNWHIVEVIDDFNPDVTQFWYYRTSRNTTVLIGGSSADAGKYQDKKRVYRWKFELKRFRDEDAAYAWLRLSDFYAKESGVQKNGKSKFTAHKIFLDEDFGWQNDGSPYYGV